MIEKPGSNLASPGFLSQNFTIADIKNKLELKTIPNFIKFILDNQEQIC